MSDKSRNKEREESQENLKDELRSQGLKDEDSLDSSLDEYNQRGSDNLGDTGEDSSNSDPCDSCGSGGS